MPTGFQSINDWGTVQIDENYSVTCLRQAPVITVSSFPDKTYYDVYGECPLLFLGNTNGAGVVVLSRVSIGTNLWRFSLMASSAVNVKIYIFDKGPPAYGNHGMQVFNSGGVLTYDSGASVLALKGVYQMSGVGPNSFGVPQDGRTYAAAMSFSRMWVDKKPVSHAFWDIYQEAMWVSAGSLYIDDMRTGRIGGEDPGSKREKRAVGPPQILLADVTYM